MEQKWYNANMATVNPRLNITLDAEQLKLISKLARKEKRSRSAVAKNLIEQALDMLEDMALSQISEKRLKTNKKLYTHKEVWG